MSVFSAKPASLKRKLLLPSLLLAAAIAGAGLWAIYADTERQFSAGLQERAQLIASMTNYAAEGLPRAGELQRIVAAMGADRDVLDIVVVGGSPARVLASTRGVWRDRLLSELPAEEVANDLVAAIRARETRTHFNAEQHLYDLTAPLVLSQTAPVSGPFADGAVMVHLDTRPMYRAIVKQGLKLFAALLLATVIFSLFIYARLTSVVLHPIAMLSARVTQHQLGVIDHAGAAPHSDDEIGELSRLLSQALMQTDVAVRALADQKFALDQHSIVAVTDARGRITYVNDKFCKLSQYSREELLGQDHRIINSKHHPKEYIAELWRTLKSGHVWHGELKNRAKDGSFYWVDSTLVPLLDADGRPSQFIAIRTDITEHKRAEEALIIAKAAAEAAAAAKGEFLANMSHEIRTPMNAVIGMTSLLLDTPLQAEQRELIDTVRRSSDALLGIINDVLDYSKIDAGKLELERRAFDVHDMVESVIDLFATQAEEKHLDLIYELDDQLPRWLTGDVMRVRQILVNLVSNALKFTSIGDVMVQVRGATPDDGTQTVTFCVRDTGIGIPSDRVGQLFHSFTQVDSSTTRRFGGTGLGLAISRRLAEMMDGQLWVESVYEQGSSFYFACPLPPSAATTLTDKEVDCPEIRGKRVLVVDDNAHTRSMVQRHLGRWGATALTADSSEAAIALIQREAPFAVVLIDKAMPDVAGPAFAARLRARLGAATPPLVSLGGVRLGASIVDDGAGFHARIAKPIKPRALKQGLAQALGTPKAQLTATGDEPAARTSPLADQFPLKVLIAEDNPVNQRVATMMLERLGYSADVVGTGLESLTAAGAREYDLILMDVHMPDMDGLEAARQIRRLSNHRGHHPWIVAVTASAMDEERAATIQAGMDDFVSKPVRREDLEGLVLRLVRAREVRAELVTSGVRAESEHTLIRELRSVVHLDELLENVSGCRESAEMVVDEFLRNVESQLHGLRVAIESGDGTRIQGAAHFYKGSLGAIRAVPTHVIANAIELAGQRCDLARANVLFEELRSLSVELVAALCRWRGTHTSSQAEDQRATLP
ncbi:MAG: response regulator [Polyangiales bacterium]